MDKKKLAIAVTSAVILLLGAGYLGGRYYFRDHYYPRTVINSVNVGSKTLKDAVSSVKNKLDTYKLTIHSQDRDMTITAADCGLEYEDTKAMNSILNEQDENLWFAQVFQVHNINAMFVKLDEEKLTNAINNLYCMNPDHHQKPTNAKITYHEDTKTFEIDPEVIGTTIIPDKFSQAVNNCIMTGADTLDLTTNEYYEQPKYFSTDDIVVAAKATVDKYMSAVITYSDSGLSYVLDSSKIREFIKISKKFEVSLKKDQIKTFVSQEISPVFNTVGTKREINSPGSGTFTAEGGSYGWQVGLIDERDALIENIKAGAVITREPVYLQDAASKDRSNDIGDSYVDVNIEAQHLWVVQKGEVVLESDFVSGNTSTGHDTDKGVYMIEYKRRNYEMRDYDVTVKYWMPFNTEVGEGFHDAKWRKSFGGNIYKHDGSHGCVNLPTSVAKQMYEMLDRQFPVIVH